MRRVFLAAVFALVSACVWGIGASAQVGVGTSAASASGGNQPPSPPKRPPPPSKAGCYQFRTDAWRPVACASQRYIRRHFRHLQLQDGISSVPVGSSPAAPSFVFGSIYFRFANVGTEKDGVVGPNAYSIQNNVTFTGTNGDPDGIQFAEQVRPPGPVGICIWQVDIKKQTYPKTCTTAPGDVPLAAGDQPQVQGFVRPGHLLALEAYVPWSTKVEYAVVAHDRYGLAGRWKNISGSVLGWGNSSEAIFSSAELETIVDVSTCDGAPGTAACPEQPTLKPHAISSYSGATGETNNLMPVIGNPPPFLPALQQLAVDQADIEYVSTANGVCPTGTSPPLCGLSPGNG